MTSQCVLKANKKRGPYQTSMLEVFSKLIKGYIIDGWDSPKYVSMRTAVKGGVAIKFFFIQLLLIGSKLVIFTHNNKSKRSISFFPWVNNPLLSLWLLGESLSWTFMIGSFFKGVAYNFFYQKNFFQPFQINKEFL